MKAELADVRECKSERIKWMEHFKNFENITELDRKAVIQLIQSIHIISKKELKISFNYQLEYKKIENVVNVYYASRQMKEAG